MRYLPLHHKAPSPKSGNSKLISIPLCSAGSLHKHVMSSEKQCLQLSLVPLCPNYCRSALHAILSNLKDCLALIQTQGIPLPFCIFPLRQGLLESLRLAQLLTTKPSQLSRLCFVSGCTQASVFCHLGTCSFAS